MKFKKILLISLVGAVLSSNSFAFKYHDNQVDFYSTIASIQSDSSFKLKDFYIPTNQDPDKHIKTGHNHVFHDHRYFSFTAGRHGNTGTAKWFSKRFGGNKNTFDSKPNKLNFALKGNLKLHLKHFTKGYKELPQGTYTFNSIALAQGHVASRNNWWLGGSECRKISGFPTVKCKGTGPKGKVVWGYFLSPDKVGKRITRSIRDTALAFLFDDGQYLVDAIKRTGSSVSKMSLYHISYNENDDGRPRKIL